MIGNDWLLADQLAMTPILGMILAIDNDLLAMIGYVGYVG